MSKIVKNTFLLATLACTAGQPTVLAKPWDELRFPSEFTTTQRQFTGGLRIKEAPEPKHSDPIFRIENIELCPEWTFIRNDWSDCTPRKYYSSDKYYWINHTPLVSLLLLTGSAYSEHKNLLFNPSPSEQHIQIITQCGLGPQHSISPYRQDLRKRLAQNWYTENKIDAPTILITLDREGRLLKAEIYEPTGNRDLEKAALYAATVTKFSPLPDWCKELEMTFKINMRTLAPSKRPEEPTPSVFW